MPSKPLRKSSPAPLPRIGDSRVIRPELNLEQWSLWQPTNARGELRAKVLEKEITLSDGTAAVARVTVDFTSLGALTTEDQKTLYGLIKIWEDKGESITYTYLSVSELLKTLKKSRGPNTVNGLVKSLRRLRRNQIDWQLSYMDAETGEHVSTFEDPFTILTDLKIISREKNGMPLREEGYFRFHPLIVKNLVANHRRPVLFDTVLSLKGDIAQLLYTLVDRTLSVTTQFERRTERLFQELGLVGVDYHKPAARKRTVERALRELLHKPLSAGGIIAEAYTTLTEDKKDYKVVLTKDGSVEPVSPPVVSSAPEMVQESDLVQQLNAEFGISLARARILERDHPKECLEWLAAKAYVHDWPNKGAGFWIQAITKPDEFELPVAYRGAKEKKVRRSREDSLAQLQKRRTLHEEAFSDAFQAYLEEREAYFQNHYPEAYQAFLDDTASERAKNERYLSVAHVLKALSLGLFQNYFADFPDCPVLAFWQWDATLNPTPFQAEA